MKGTTYLKEAVLTPEEIDLFSEKVTEYLKGLKTEKKELLRIRFSVENVLLKWQLHFGETMKVKLSCYTYLGQPMIRLTLLGDPYDPLNEAGQDECAWSNKLLSNLQCTPLYHYTRNLNTVTFKLQRKHLSPILLLVAALALAAIVGSLGLFLPENVRLFAAESVLTPLCNTFLNVMNVFAIPLIFLTLTLGICGVGDISAFGRIGKKMLAHFFLVLLLVTVLSGVLSLPFFDFTMGGGSISLAFDDFRDMVLDFLPTGIFTPFLECNAVQLIILGAAFGFAMLKLHPVTTTFTKILDDVNSILLLISELFTRLLPIFVFATVVNSIWSGHLLEILSWWKCWVITIGLQVLLLGAIAVQICVKNKIGLPTLLKKLFGTFVVAFGTNSCSATISEIFNGLSNLGIQPQLSGLGVPIGTSIFKPACAIRLVVLSYFVASVNHMNVSIEWFLLAMFMAFVLSIAIPAIPGGTLMFCPLLFVQLGIPAETITAILAVDIFFDAICTAFNQISVELALVQQAEKLKMLDEKTLRKTESK